MGEVVQFTIGRAREEQHMKKVRSLNDVEFSVYMWLSSRRGPVTAGEIAEFDRVPIEVVKKAFEKLYDLGFSKAVEPKQRRRKKPHDNAYLGM
jgi:hypothetical protein